MEKAVRYTLGKNERLKSRKAIDFLFSNGQSFSAFPFRVIYQFAAHKEGGPVLQAAFSVSKRHFKKAVDRNRVKRLMREAYRLQKNGLQTQLQNNHRQLLVFILYTGKEVPEFDTVSGKTAGIIKRMQKILNEETPSNT